MLAAIAAKLEELSDVQQQLLDVAEQKRQIIIERKIEELNELVKQEAKLIDRLSAAESEREQLVEEFLGLHPALSFQEALGQAPDELARKKVVTQMAALQQGMSDLQAKNKVNERLLKDAIHFVQHMIEQVTKSKQQNFNYQSPMQTKSTTASRGFFDTKA
jgi:flagellar biosynthesis/type III secretory pathway chaperone